VYPRVANHGVTGNLRLRYDWQKNTRSLDCARISLRSISCFARDDTFGVVQTFLNALLNDVISTGGFADVLGSGETLRGSRFAPVNAVRARRGELLRSQ
jgi:hypothetical protein